MKKPKQNISKLKLIVAFLMALQAVFIAFGAHAKAATLTNTTVRLDRMAASTATSLRVIFTVPSGNSATEANLKISFPDSFTVATSGHTSSVASCGATSLPGTFTITGSNTNGSKNINIGGVTNLSASTAYCVDLTKSDAVTTPTAGSYSLTVETLTSAPATIDSTNVAVRVISNDQITVSATVPPSFTFVLDSNSTSFTTNLDSTSVVQTTLRTATITTNASKGWIAWAKDANTGLTSSAAGKTIASTTPGTTATLSAGTEGYVLGVDKTDAAGGGTVTVTSAYAGTSGDNAGSGLDTTLRQIASSNGTAGGSGDVVKLYGKAAIAGDTPAATDYADTWTVIGAGSF